MKLDYTIESPEERKQLVEEIIANTPDITPQYLEVLADYLILSMEKQERKEHKILTENRMSTVNKRETSFEGLVSQFENGEDGIYNLINENKHTILQPKISITEDDLKIPCLRQLRDAIGEWEAALKRASGRDAFIIKKALIEMRKDQYLIKQAYQKPIAFKNITRGMVVGPCLDDTTTLQVAAGGPIVKTGGVTFTNPQVISAILCNYSQLKEDSWGCFTNDLWALMESFDELADAALRDHPVYEYLVEQKVDGVSNEDISILLLEKFGKTYTPEYISALWRQKIPKLIANEAMSRFLTWEYTHRDFPMKKCTKCGQIKPAHNHFFSKNNTSCDGWYSVCKECRSVKKGDE